jgi:hypothetical protein
VNVFKKSLPLTLGILFLPTHSVCQSNPSCSTQDLLDIGRRIAKFEIAEQKRPFSADQIRLLVSAYQDELLSEQYRSCGHPLVSAADPNNSRQKSPELRSGESSASLPAENEPTRSVQSEGSFTVKYNHAPIEQLDTDPRPAPANPSSGQPVRASTTMDRPELPGFPAAIDAGTTAQNSGATQGVGLGAGKSLEVVDITPDESSNPKSVISCSNVDLKFRVVATNSSVSADLATARVIVRDMPGDNKTEAIVVPEINNLQKDGEGAFSLSLVPPGTHRFLLSIEQPFALDPSSTPEIDLQVSKLGDSTGSSSPCVYPMPPLMLTAIGVDVESASSTSPQATFLGNVSIDLPVLWQFRAQKRMNDIRNGWLFVGGSLRIAGMAQPGSLSAAAFTSAGYYASAINATPDKIVQSWEGTASVAIKFGGTDLGIGTFDGGKPPYPTYPRRTFVSTSFLLSGGFNSPLSASQANAPVFYATSQIQNAFPSYFPSNTPTSPCAFNTTKNTWPCYVAFIPEDRTRFYRNYEAGLRLKLYGEDFEHNMLLFPGIIDLTVGQNEYVTGGRLDGAVLHLGGVVPIPIPKVDGIFAFGAMDSEVNGPLTSCGKMQGNCSQLLLSPVPSTANVTYLSPGVYDVTVPQPNRDRYRFGIGIDLYHLFTAKSQSSKSTNTDSKVGAD